MKKILVATDFSPAADNAARYALNLAGVLRTGIKLCTAFKVPAETPMAAQVVWPLEDYTSLKSETMEDLKSLAEKLINEEFPEKERQSFYPLIDYTSEIGTVTAVIRNLMEDQRLPLVVMGMSGAGMMSRFFLGSSSREMIEKASAPVLLIPSQTAYKDIKKIAFATDLSTGDIDVIHSLAGLAYPFNAEILLAHVTPDSVDGPYQRKIDNFLNEVTCKVNYPRIYYRPVKSSSIDHGLEWLAANGQADMLAMVHRKQNIFDRMLTGSHTQKLARHIKLPLLVFPQGYQSII
ncbi:MAG: hypothetical protein NVSMB24_34410 [Mucilaginibacter sp.]